MSAQHTPGPWHINTIETVLHSIRGHRGHVADVSRGSMNEVQADEIEANARLIAAAPTLLDALDRIASGEFANVVSWEDRIAALREIARSAIAKAGGDK